MRTDLANSIIDYGQKHPDDLLDADALKSLVAVHRDTFKNREKQNNIVPTIIDGKKHYRGYELPVMLKHRKPSRKNNK